MTAGNPLSRNTLDAQLGQLAVRFVTLITAGQSINAYVDGVTDADLAAAGYDPDEITGIRKFAQVGGALGALCQGEDVATAMSELGGTLPYPFLAAVIPLTGGQVAI